MDDDNDPSNIWVACSDGDEDRVRYLLSSCEATINSQDDSGYSPIHAASSYGHVNLLKYLITCGADVNLRDFDGDTPLHVCETREVAQILIDSGADTRALNGAGQSIFETALQEENHDMVEFLAEKGLNFMNNISFTTHTMETLEEEESDGDDG